MSWIAGISPLTDPPHLKIYDTSFVILSFRKPFFLLNWYFWLNHLDQNTDKCSCHTGAPGCARLCLTRNTCRPGQWAKWCVSNFQVQVWNWPPNCSTARCRAHFLSTAPTHSLCAARPPGSEPTPLLPLAQRQWNSNKCQRLADDISQAGGATAPSSAAASPYHRDDNEATAEEQGTLNSAYVQLGASQGRWAPYHQYNWFSLWRVSQQH